ncbi:putative N protein [Trifolium pratense virus B]|uniref:Nucleoprotein n=1 Tax=Trifolium pratense virus B TaxID=2448907 RepID=A0A510C2H0_9RHAB|nr:putative N protein [Trifolium pratense virus B]AYH53268.1 putative N protein [Trifolium pratense virus B]
MSETTEQKMERLRKIKEGMANASTKPAQETAKTVNRVVNTLYDAVDDVTVGKRAAIKWSDAELSKVVCYDVQQVTAGSMISMGKNLLTHLTSGNVNSSTVDICLTLAISIPTPATRAFSYMLTPLPENIGRKIDFELPTASASVVKGLSEIQKKQLEKSRVAIGEETDEEKKKVLQTIINRLEAQESGVIGTREQEMGDQSDAAAYSFLAASLIKLCAKTAESYIEGLPRMRDRFSSWYDTNSNILRTFTPTETALNSLRTAFSRRPEILSTWVLWVAYNENKAEKLLVTHQGLLTYLAGQQFSYPGMHAYTLMIEIHEHTGIKFGQLLREMDCPATRDGVKEVLEIIRDYEVTKAHPNRTTYFRYARNWDHKYFGNLQSTQCKTLVYVAAVVCKKISAQGLSGDPTEIYAIKSLDPTLRGRLDVVADKMAHMIIDQMLVDTLSGKAWT